MTGQVIPLRKPPPQPARRPWTLSLATRLLLIAVPCAFAIGWLLAWAVVPLVPPKPATAEERRMDFAVRAGDLRRGLETYARQAGVRLSFDPAQVAGLTTDGLSGRHTAMEGLDILLRGTGFSGLLKEDRYVLIPNTPPAAKQPPPQQRVAKSLLPA